MTLGKLWLSLFTVDERPLYWNMPGFSTNPQNKLAAPYAFSTRVHDRGPPEIRSEPSPDSPRKISAPRPPLSKEALNKSILDLSASVTGKRSFPVTHKIDRLDDQFWQHIPAPQEPPNKSALP